MKNYTSGKISVNKLKVESISASRISKPAIKDMKEAIRAVECLRIAMAKDLEKESFWEKIKRFFN